MRSSESMSSFPGEQLEAGSIGETERLKKDDSEWNLEGMGSLGIPELEELIIAEGDWFKKLIALGLYRDELRGMSQGGSVPEQKFQFLGSVVRENADSPLVIFNVMRIYSEYLDGITDEVLRLKLKTELYDALQDSWEASKVRAEDKPVALYSPAFNYPRWLVEAGFVEGDKESKELRYWAERNLKDLLEAKHFETNQELLTAEQLGAFFMDARIAESAAEMFERWEKTSGCYGQTPRLDDGELSSDALKDVEKLYLRLEHWLKTVGSKLVKSGEQSGADKLAA